MSEVNLPELLGSEKQIKWAVYIRDEFITSMHMEDGINDKYQSKVNGISRGLPIGCKYEYYLKIRDKVYNFAISHRSAYWWISKEKNTQWHNKQENRYSIIDIIKEDMIDEERNLANQERIIKEDNIAALKNLPYKEYLTTEHWKNTKLHKLVESKYKCQLCSNNGGLNVHHNNYNNIGCEELSDLIVLCEDCHGKFHNH